MSQLDKILSPKTPGGTSTPLISVVIPTAGRPDFLAEAINSALASTASGACEVIVVPNGPDQSWIPVAERYIDDSRVRFSPTLVAHANAARNHGLALASGKFVRFLDDDDLILPGATDHQCELLSVQNSEICSGAVTLTDAGLKPFRRWPQPDVTDFIEAVLSPLRVTAIHAHVYRRSAIERFRWDESIALGQDTHWMHFLCQNKEWRWTKTSSDVAIWRHHNGARISSSSRKSKHMKVSAGYLLSTLQALEAKGRLDDSRRRLGARALWHLIHSSFFMDPRYWIPILKDAQRIFPNTYPDLAIYRHASGRLIPPLVLEMLMVPKRRINHAFRVWRFKRGIGGVTLPP